MRKEETVGSLPPHVQLMLLKLDQEEKDQRRKQSLLGKKTPLNEKTIGCNCQLEQLCDQHRGEQIKVDYIVFSDPVVSRREPVSFQIAKNDD